MTVLTHTPSTRFTVPDQRFAAEPAERRGLPRDGVRLLVADGRTGRVEHTRFDRLPDFLEPGDLIVVNNSRTVAAELDARGEGNRPVVLHVATELDDGSWVVELRTAPDAAEPILTARPGQLFRFGDDVKPTGSEEAPVSVRLLEPYPAPGREYGPGGVGNRLWRARIDSAVPFGQWLARHGRPISYGYLSRHWPLADYQTVFGLIPGSAEMPSAGRPFSTELVTRLVSAGVLIAPITLHTGVSSQETGEGPQPERFTVPATTARLVNDVRCSGGRVIAVGTTVTRALESAADADGFVLESRGWTELVLGPDQPSRVVGGLITGLHNPDASHLLLVEAVAGAELTQRTYDAAVAGDYLWHEFGDSCLILPA
ncbi:MAG TPA: S-adenosylmethionine:tRNA ribosyltransferase-isomerase [Jatrophihabitans sp.]|nr:S-adenosylmethionine:tRNA ribosyltransferase-isomerase [Jatrophihabitans sp.]